MATSTLVIPVSRSRLANSLTSKLMDGVHEIGRGVQSGAMTERPAGYHAVWCLDSLGGANCRGKTLLCTQQLWFLSPGTMPAS